MRRNLFALCATFLAALSYVGSAIAIDPKLDPGTAPAPTFKTLDQIPPTWDQVLAPAVRFKLVMSDQAVLDKETGLVWMRTPSGGGPGDLNNYWDVAVRACVTLAIQNRLGWRLPSVQELASLLEPSGTGYSLPSGHPFTGIPGSGPGRRFWSSTSDAQDAGNAWVAGDVIRPESKVCVGSGGLTFVCARTWCVRGGRGTDEQ